MTEPWSRLAATDVSLFLGAKPIGAGLSNGSALLLITPDGVAGQLSGGVSLNLGSGVGASVQSVTITLNELASQNTPIAVNEAFTVGGGTQTLVLPAGRYLNIAAQGVQITVAKQTLSGDLTVSVVENLTPQGTLPASNPTYTTTLTLANGALTIGTTQRNFVVVSGAAGTLTITTGGVFGTVAANVAVTIPGITVGGTFSASLNTTGQTTSQANGSLAPDSSSPGRTSCLESSARR